MSKTRIYNAFSAFRSLCKSFLLQSLDHFNVHIWISSWTVFFNGSLCLHKSFDHFWSLICVNWFNYSRTYFTLQNLIYFFILLIVKIIYKCWVFHCIRKMLVLKLFVHEFYLIRGTSSHFDRVYLPLFITS